MTDVRDRIVQLWIAHDNADTRLAEQYVDQQRIKAIIDGTRNPSTYDIAAIAEAFGVTVAWLLTGDDHGLDEEYERYLREETIGAQWHRRAARAEEALAAARETNRRLNHRAQKAESKLATIQRAVGEWQYGAGCGTYVPFRSLGAIAKTVGREVPDEWELHYQRVERAEAQVARIRAFLEDMAGWCSPHGVAADYSRRALDALDGVDPLGLAGPTREEQEADSYAAKVNAPLSPETIAALHDRLAAGDYPVRKIPPRGSRPAKPGRATMAADRCPRCGGDNTDPWALCGNCETAGEQR